MNKAKPVEHPADFQRLTDALESWRHWSPKLTRAPDILAAITQGKTNLSFLIATSAGKAVLRLNTPEAETLGIQRQQEAKILNCLLPYRMHPDIWYLNPEAGLLVTEYIEADCHSAASLPEVARPRLRQLLEQIFRTPLDIPRFDYARYLARYWQLAAVQQRPSLLWRQQWEKFFPNLLQWQSNLAEPVLCHHDLLGDNILLSDDSLYIIDWEYAGMGCPDLDLISCGMTPFNHVNCKEIELLQEILLWLERLWLVLNVTRDGKSDIFQAQNGQNPTN